MKTFLLGVLLLAAAQASAESYFQSEEELAIAQAFDERNFEPIEATAENSHGYNQALALYWLSQQDYSKQNMGPAQEKLAAAEAILKGREDAESKVLLAAVYGMKMGINPQLGGSLYPVTMGLLEAAESDESARPRALMVKGVNLFHTPPVFGGGADKALNVLKAAKQAYEQQRANQVNTLAHWGESQTDWWLNKAELAVSATNSL